MSLKIEENIEKEIIKRYISNSENVANIAKGFNISIRTINNILRRNNITRLAHKRCIIKCNDDFFDRIDTESKAYFLGLMMADGCLPIGKKISGIVQISLNIKDIEILEKFKECIKYEGNIRKFHYKKEFNKNWVINPNTGPQCILKFTSYRMRESLIKHGCVPRKSLVLKWPDSVPDHLINHFVRGYIDGDGWICSGKKIYNQVCGIVSSKDFCVEFSKNISRILYIGGSISRKNKIYRWDIGGSRQFLKFCEWLYRDATIYLNRKYKNYLDGKSIILGHRLKFGACKGENHYKCKFNEETVKNILNDYKNNINIESLSIKYNTSKSNIRKIVLRKTWKHIKIAP